MNAQSPDCPPWRIDPCPRPPLVLADELALPRGRPCPAPRLLGDVHATTPWVHARDRALAVALCAPAGHGVVVRRTAAWVWTGAAGLRPEHVDLALPPDGPPLPGRRGGPRMGLRVARWDSASRWTLLGGVPVTDPVTTATECARLLPAPVARTCVEALAATPGFDVLGARARLRAGGPRPGRQQALDLLAGLPENPRTLDDDAQSWATSRCTPLVTR